MFSAFKVQTVTSREIIWHSTKKCSSQSFYFLWIALGNEDQNSTCGLSISPPSKTLEVYKQSSIRTFQKTLSQSNKELLKLRKYPQVSGVCYPNSWGARTGFWGFWFAPQWYFHCRPENLVVGACSLYEASTVFTLCSFRQREEDDWLLMTA